MQRWWWTIAAVLVASALVTGVAEATQVTIYATTPDGHIYGSDATYATARSTSDFEDASGTTFGVGQATGYTVYRGFLAFDTGAVLPADATVTDVKLGMKVSNNFSTTDFVVTVKEFAWTSPLVTNKETDYDGCLAEAGGYTWKDTSDGGFTTGTYYESASLTNGYVAVGSGTTYYCLISSRDSAGTTPTNNEFLYLYAAEQSGTGSDPYLVVTYTTPTPTSTPTVATATPTPTGASPTPTTTPTSAPTATPTTAACGSPPYTITTNVDSTNAGALRWAVNCCNGDTITVPAGTYTLTLGQITVPQNCTISGDTAANTIISAGDTSRVFEVAANKQVTFEDLTIRDGYINGSGAGIMATAGTGWVAVTRCIIADNIAYHSGGSAGGSGGGINAAATTTVTDTTFSGNNGDFDGGAIHNAGTKTLTVTGSTFTANYAGPLPWGAPGPGSDGGAIYTAYSDTIVTNSTFRGNGAQYVGADLYVRGTSGTIVVKNSTFDGTDGYSIFGSALGADGLEGAVTITVTNSILTHATAIAGGNCWSNTGGTITNGGNNIDDATTCGWGSTSGSMSSTDPLLDPAGLADNGGETETIALCIASGSPSGCTGASPALNAGSAATCAAAPVSGVDQRGETRPGTGTSVCAVGAYEAQIPATPTPTATPTGPTATPITTATPTSTRTPTWTRTPTPTSVSAATATRAPDYNPQTGWLKRAAQTPGTDGWTLQMEGGVAYFQPPAIGRCCGDCNGDGAVTFAEVTQLFRAAAGLDYTCPAGLGAMDCTGDGVVDITDGSTAIDIMKTGGACPGYSASITAIYGHQQFVGPAPTVGAGGCTVNTITTSPVSTDAAGEVTLGGTCSSVSGITLLFGLTWGTAPRCTAFFTGTNAGGLTVKGVTTTTTGMILQFSGNVTSGDTVGWHCVGTTP